MRHVGQQAWGSNSAPYSPPKDALLSPSASLLSRALATSPRAAHLVVVASTEEDVVGGGVPLDQSHTLGCARSSRRASVMFRSARPSGSPRSAPAERTEGQGWWAQGQESPRCPFLGRQICLVRHLLVRAVGRVKEAGA